MRTRNYLAAFSLLAVVALVALPAEAGTVGVVRQWDLVTDWTQTGTGANSPGVFGYDPVSGANDVWQLKVDDTAANKGSFADWSQNYYTPDGPDANSDPDAHFFSGYAHATRAFGKFYGTPGAGGINGGVLPVHPDDLIALPANRNGSPGGSGPVDKGDLFAISGMHGGAAHAWFKAPRQMRIRVNLDTYSVDTNGNKNLPIDFVIRNGPASPALPKPEFNGTVNFGSATPYYKPDVGREFNNMAMPEFTLEAGEHVMLRIMGGAPQVANSGIGISSFRVQEIGIIPEPASACLALFASLALIGIRRK